MRVLRPREPLPALQILRFVAAFMVVLYHVGSGLSIEYGGVDLSYLSHGTIGVDIFFVLSGFIIGHTTDYRRGPLYFAERRVARIVPLYWVLTTGVIIIALARPSLLNSTVVNLETIVKSYLFIPYQKENGYVQPILFLGWTLMYEVYFYLVFAMFLSFGSRAPVLAVAFITAVVVAGALFPDGPLAWRFYTRPITLEFALGLLIWMLATRTALLPRGSQLSAALLLVGAVAIFVLGLQPAVADWPLRDLLFRGLPSALAVTGAVVAVVPDTRVTRGLVTLGDASYSLYLSHPYIIQVPIKLLGHAVPFAVAALLASLSALVAIAVSVGLYVFLEMPAKRLVLGWFGAAPRRTEKRLSEV